MKPKRLTWKLVPVLWLAFMLRVWALEGQSLWYDEGYSYYLGAHLPLDQAIDLTVRDIVPPLYYLLLRLWTPSAGASAYALRFPSALFGLAAVALLARISSDLARTWASRPTGKISARAGFLGGTLSTVAPILIWLSQDARMYGPLLTTSLLAAWGLLRALATQSAYNERKRGWMLFVGAGLASLYLHTVSVFWLLGQIVFALVITWQQRRHRDRVRETLVALGLIAVGYLPWAIIALISYQTNTGYWPGFLPPPYLWRVAWETFVGGQHLAPALTRLAGVWFGAAALLSWMLLLLKRSRVALYLVCYLVIPLLAMGIAFMHTPKLAPRYPTAMAPALFLTLAVGKAISIDLSRITRYISLIALLGVALVSVYATVNLLSNPAYGKDDWRAVADYVKTHREPKEPVILISGHSFSIFAYYYGWEGWHALPDDVLLDVNHVLNYPAVVQRLNAILDQATGAWLVLWQEEVIDPTDLVTTVLRDAGQEQLALVFPGSTAGDQISLRHYSFEAPIQLVQELPLQHTLHQDVAPGLSILGYSLPAQQKPGDSQRPLPADTPITVRAFWQADKQLQGTYAASLRLTDRLEQEWGREDSLLAGPYFSERWPPATPIMGNYTVTLPVGAPPGAYTPTLMVYQDDRVFDSVHLAPIVITRPLNIPSPSELGLSRPFDIDQPRTVGWDGELAVVGVGFDQTIVTPCRPWSFSLAWKAEAQPSHGYRLDLQVGTSRAEMPLAVDYPTTNWQPGDLWRTRHHLLINCRERDGTFPVTAQLLDDDRKPTGDPFDLGQLVVIAGREYSLPSDLTAVLDVKVYENQPSSSDEMEMSRLLGYRLSGEHVKPGGNLTVALYWRVGHETDQNYSVFAHLVSDRVWAQHDGWPSDGQKPTSTWASEEVITDRHVIPIGPDVPPGSYRLVVGMYDVITLEPLTAVDANGHPIEEGRIVLQPITVHDP